MEKNVVISLQERCNGQKERCNGKKERCQSPIVWSKMFGPIFSWKYFQKYFFFYSIETEYRQYPEDLIPNIKSHLMQSNFYV